MDALFSAKDIRLRVSETNYTCVVWGSSLWLVEWEGVNCSDETENDGKMEELSNRAVISVWSCCFREWGVTGEIVLKLSG